MAEKAIELVFPSAKHKKLCEEFVKAHEGEKHVPGASGIEKLPFDEWLEKVRAKHEGENLPKGYVPSTNLLCLYEGRLVGIVDIRHHLNERLLAAGGHIGYTVHKAERRKGFGKAVLQASAAYAKKHFGITTVLVTCHENNEASRRTIKACGGVYENTVYDEELGDVERYWIDV